MKLIAGYRLSHMKFSCSKVVVGANSINYCSDSSEMWMSSMAVRDILLFSSTLTGANAASYADAFDLLGIKELSDQSFGSLSAGQKQRVHLAQSILQPEPSLMLLDEPLSALDENNAISCLRLLQLLPTSHSFDYCSQALTNRGFDV
jgi:ABC-type Mn2+/Zn2+ transport system ATPase subunit